MTEGNFPERIIPVETASGPLSSHLVRYQFAAEYCSGARVLDAACGVGYGAPFLAQRALFVLAVDISEEAVAYARANYARPNVRFEIADVEELPSSAGQFDVICSFETVEHLKRPERFLRNLTSLLTPDGVFIVSTPKAPETTFQPANPHHHVEYSPQDFKGLLERFFADVTLLGQTRRQTPVHRWLQRVDIFRLRTRIPRRLRNGLARASGTAAWEEAGISDFSIGSDLRNASEIVAICRRPTPSID